MDFDRRLSGMNFLGFSLTFTYFWWTLTSYIVDSRALPVVDPGLFVISGVSTCGSGDGYCLLGLDCTLNEDFLPDNSNGHCNGLKNAFTPIAYFVCCRYKNRLSVVNSSDGKQSMVVWPSSPPPASTDKMTEFIIAKTQQHTTIDTSNNPHHHRWVESAQNPVAAVHRSTIDNDDSDYMRRVNNSDFVDIVANDGNSNIGLTTAVVVPLTEENSSEVVPTTTTTVESVSETESAAIWNVDSDDKVPVDVVEEFPTVTRQKNVTDVKVSTNAGIFNDDRKTTGNEESSVSSPRIEPATPTDDSVDIKDTSADYLPTTTAERIGSDKGNGNEIKNKYDDKKAETDDNNNNNDDVDEERDEELLEKVLDDLMESDNDSSQKEPSLRGTNGRPKQENQSAIDKLATAHPVSVVEPTEDSLLARKQLNNNNNNNNQYASDYSYGSTSFTSINLNVGDSKTVKTNEPSSLSVELSSNGSSSSEPPQVEIGKKKHSPSQKFLSANEPAGLYNRLQSEENDNRFKDFSIYDKSSVRRDAYDHDDDGGEQGEKKFFNSRTVLSKEECYDAAIVTGFGSSSSSAASDEDPKANSVNNNNACANRWKFSIDDERFLCYGVLLNPLWLVTSASCIMKIFQLGMSEVTAFSESDDANRYGISNIIVHENYRSSDQKTKLEVNNIGLVSLSNYAENVACLPCIPKSSGSVKEKLCHFYNSDQQRPDNNNLSSGNGTDIGGICEGRIKSLNTFSDSYLTLSCKSSTAAKTHKGEYYGNSLWCGDMLAGVETATSSSSSSTEMFVYTPIAEFVPWISQNIRLYST